MKKLTVHRIDDQGDRVLLYDKPTGSQFGEFHVIARPAQAAGLKLGDVIEYEPYGVNFGWFVKAVVPAEITDYSDLTGDGR